MQTLAKHVHLTAAGVLAAVSSACLYGLMVVVAAIVFRSSQVVLSPDYDWGPVRAFNPSISFLNALPLIVFAFQVVWPPLGAAASPADRRCCGGRLSAGLPPMQCHTNVVSIWDELEPQPALLRRAAATSRALAPEHSPRGDAQQRGMSRKLAGMVCVLAAGVGVTGLFYCCVGERTVA